MLILCRPILCSLEYVQLGLIALAIIQSKTVVKDRHLPLIRELTQPDQQLLLA